MSEVSMEFKGKTYVIPENRAFEVVDMVEDVVTVGQIPQLFHDPKFGKIAKAYGIMLRFAGCRVSDDDVHRDMTERMRSGKAGAGRIAAIEALMSISALIMRGAMNIESESDGDEAPEKTDAS